MCPLSTIGWFSGHVVPYICQSPNTDLNMVISIQSYCDQLHLNIYIYDNAHMYSICTENHCNIADPPVDSVVVWLFPNYFFIAQGNHFLGESPSTLYFMHFT